MDCLYKYTIFWEKQSEIRPIRPIPNVHAHTIGIVFASSKPIGIEYCFDDVWIKDPPPDGFLYGDCTLNRTVLKHMSYGVDFWQKSLVYLPGGNFSNYFMKILVFSQLYRSKSATQEIAYDMKIDFLLCNLYFPLKQQSAKTIRMYIKI